MPAGFDEHLPSSLWLWGNFQKAGESQDKVIKKTGQTLFSL